MIRLLATLLLLAGPAVSAEALLAARLIRVGDVLSPEDLVRGDTEVAGGLTAPDDLIGQEARVTLFPGRPLIQGDVGPPRLVRRNELVTLVYVSGRLNIRTEGRSLSDGAAGDLVQVMNLDSRTRLSGVVTKDGLVLVE